MSRETKLTRYTLYALAVLITLYFMTPARADDNDVINMSAFCSASHALLGVLNDKPVPEGSSVVSRLMFEEGKWWREFLIAWTDNESASDFAIEVAAKQLQDAWNSGNIDNDGMVDIAQQCSAMKAEILSAQE